MSEEKVRTIPGDVTLELHGYLADLKVRPLESADLNGETAIENALLEVGIPIAAIELVVVNGSLVGKKYPIQPGDKVAIYPITVS